MGWLIFIIVIMIMLGGVGMVTYLGMLGNTEILEKYGELIANAGIVLWFMPAGVISIIIFLLVAYSLGTKSTLSIDGSEIILDDKRIDLKNVDIRLGKWKVKFAGMIGSIFYFYQNGVPISIACFGAKYDSEKYNINPSEKFDYGINDHIAGKKFADLVLEKKKDIRPIVVEKVFDFQKAENGWQNVMIMGIFYAGSGLLSLLGYFVFNSSLEEKVAVPIFIVGIYVFVIGMIVIGNLSSFKKGLRLVINETEVKVVDPKSGQEKTIIPIVSTAPQGKIWKTLKQQGVAITLQLDEKQIVIGCRDTSLYWSMDEGKEWNIRYVIGSDEFQEIAKALQMPNQLMNQKDYDASLSE